MLQEKNFAIIGPGVMGKTLALSLIRTGNLPPKQIAMAGPNADRLNQLALELGVRTFSDNQAASNAADIVILAVKPQRLDEATQTLKGNLSSGKLVISILAGVPISVLEQKLATRCIVRAMPNTPARIGLGITVWTKAADVDEAQQQTAAQIMCTFGEEIFVADEAYLDMATALSGTGPAYVFLFMEAMIDAGVHMGFPRRIAEQLVVQTLRGSTEFSCRAMGILQNCGMTSPRLEVPPRRRCTTLRKQVFARRSHARYGRLTSAVLSWVRVLASKRWKNSGYSRKNLISEEPLSQKSNTNLARI